MLITSGWLAGWLAWKEKHGVSVRSLAAFVEGRRKRLRNRVSGSAAQLPPYLHALRTDAFPGKLAGNLLILRDRRDRAITELRAWQERVEGAVDLRYFKADKYHQLNASTGGLRDVLSQPINPTL